MKRVSLITALFLSSFLLFFYLKPRGPQGALCAIVKFPSGAEVKCELALTHSQHAIGLMFRKELPADRGMFFIFREENSRTFWMKNTFIPLDIIFIGADLKVRKIFRGVPPYREKMKDEDIPRAGALAKYVLELSSGAAYAFGLSENDYLKIRYLRSPEKCL